MMEPPPILSVLGLGLLALTALSGWLIEIGLRRPNLYQRVGILSPKRLLQTHLDWVSMGLILIAVDVVVPERPTWMTVTIAYGLLVNPLLFLPPAWGEHHAERRSYMAVSASSYIAASVGLVSLFVYALTR